MVARYFFTVHFVIILLAVGGFTACERKPELSSPFPTVQSVKIIPESPRTTHDLNILMEGVEGSNLTLTYKWKRNGQEIFGETFRTLRNLNFSKHDTISVEVTPMQGDVQGNPVESQEVVIKNSKPIINSAVINPQPALTTSQLEVVIDASDDDDDYIVYSHQWFKNNQTRPVGNLEVLTSEYFTRGDTVYCTMTPSDPDVTGKTFTTEPVVIANSPPTISSQPPSEVVFERFFSYEVVADDADQDSLLFSLSSSSPEGITIDPSTGTVRWEIPKGLTGSYPIEIIISDGHGGKCSQTFDISIAEEAA